MATLTFDVTDEFYAYFETFNERKKRKLINFAKDALYNKIESQKVPNAETLKAFEEADKGIGINVYDSWQEMFDELMSEVEEESHAKH